MIACKMTFCPFFCEGACSNPTLTIDENGVCEQIWRKGQQNPHAFESIDDIYKRKLRLEEVSEGGKS